MLGLHPLNAIFGAAPLQDPEPGPVDPKRLGSYLGALTRIGMYPLLCHPGTEEAWDLRTPKQKTVAEEAWEATEPAERLFSHDALSREGMASPKSVTLTAWMRRGLKALGHTDKDGPIDAIPNVSVNIAASRVVVVTMETAEDVTSFKEWAAQKSGDLMWRNEHRHVTVSGPEGRSQMWFSLPEDYPVVTNALPAEIRTPGPEGTRGSFLIRIHSAHVVVPGSQTDTGVYRAVGAAEEAPKWFLDHLESTAAQRLGWANSRYGTAASPDPAAREIAAWSAETTWSDIFNAAGGWTLTDTDPHGNETWSHRTGNRMTTYAPGNPVDPVSSAADSGARHWYPIHQGSTVQQIMDATGRDTLTRFELATLLFAGGDRAAGLAALRNGTLLPAVEDAAGVAAENTECAEGARHWAAAGTVTVVAAASDLGTLDVDETAAGPGTGIELTGDMASWAGLFDAVSTGSSDLVVVAGFDELATTLAQGAGQPVEAAAAWAWENLNTLATGAGVPVVIVSVLVPPTPR